MSKPWYRRVFMPTMVDDREPTDSVCLQPLS